MDEKPKKLCIFITRLTSGGPQRVVIDILKNVNREKYTVTLIIGRTPENEANLLGEVPDDVELVRMNNMLGGIRPVRDIPALWKLFHFFRRRKFDILHLHTPKAGILGSAAGHFAGIKKIIYTPHGHIPGRNAGISGTGNISRLKMGILYLMRNTVYSFCDKIAGLSELDKERQIELKLAPPEKFCAVINGIDVNHFSRMDGKARKRIREENGIGSGSVIGSVGRLSKEKGHDILLRAFAIVNAKYLGTKLMLVGDGKEMQNLKQLAEDMDLAESVIFTGNVSDVCGYLQAMDIFVLPSYHESRGLAVMQAMAAGIPVIASNVGGVPGIIKNRKEGLLIPEGDPRLLAENIIFLLQNGELREKLSRNSRKRAKREFPVRKMISAYEKLYGVRAR